MGKVAERDGQSYQRWEGVERAWLRPLDRLPIMPLGLNTTPMSILHP